MKYDGGIKPLWVKWSAKKHKELMAILDEIDLDEFGQYHSFNLSAAIGVVIGVARNMPEYIDISHGAELNLKQRCIKLYMDSKGLKYILKHDGNLRRLSDIEMTAVINTSFSIPYKRKDGTICQRNQPERKG